jgi:hypothetical protein
MAGCPKKTVVKEEPSLKKGEEAALGERALAEREKAAKLDQNELMSQLARLRKTSTS